MTVLLVHLPVGFEESYPLSLASVASSIVEAGYSVEGLDVGRVGLRGLAGRLQRGDVRVVGLSAWSPGRLDTIQAIRAVREAPNHPFLVLGGPHPSLEPQDLDADAVVVGEGEWAFRDLVDALAAGRTVEGIPGVRTKESNSATSAREPADLAALPLPDRSVFSVGDYQRDHLPRGRRYTADVTSRGCLYQCSFCSAPKLWGRGHRYRPAEQVQANWKALHLDHGIHSILVEDDLFTQRRERVVELCETLIARPPGLTWELLNGIRPESVDPALLVLMARAGCTRMAFSIETGQTDHLRAMGRSPNVERVREHVAAAQKAGISTTGYFLIGLPRETAAERQQTFRYATTLDLDMAHFSIASAWPGTAWSATDLPAVPVRERGSYYRAWYLHPRRALRAARCLGVGVRDLPDMVRRLYRWIARPLEARRMGQ